MSVLESHGLSKDFGGLRAVHDFDFNAAEGEIIGLIGPNGSGKTTIFNVITGLYSATAGSVEFGPERREILGLRPHAVTALGIARTFQNQRLFNQMTVVENVMVGRTCRTRAGLASVLFGLPSARAEQAETRRLALELLGLFGERLRPRAEELAISLSYANRRRLEITRAMATQPRLLLLDEPAAGMNPTETRELMDDILRIRERGVTILLIEHDMKLVRGICDRVVALDHGVKIVEGNFEQVRNDPRVIEAYLGRRAAHA
jgi:branched-chain amino acid transport system ATP-binding protein